MPQGILARVRHVRVRTGPGIRIAGRDGVSRPLHEFVY